jgi:hypothetical protein
MGNKAFRDAPSVHTRITMADTHPRFLIATQQPNKRQQSCMCGKCRVTMRTLSRLGLPQPLSSSEYETIIPQHTI